METTTIGEFTLKYDPESESAKHALAFFNEIGESGSRAFFDEARRDIINHVSHFKVHSHDSHDTEYHLTLTHEDDGTYHLRKRTGY